MADKNAGKRSFTMLHLAVSANDTGSVLFALMMSDSNPNAQDELGDTPFMIALRNKNVDAARLMTKNIKPDVQNDKGRTALMEAVESGDAEAVRLVLDYKPNLLLQDNDGQTALHLAALKGAEKISSILVSQMTQLGLKNNFGKTAAACAPAAGGGVIAERIQNEEAYRIERHVKEAGNLPHQNIEVEKVPAVRPKQSRPPQNKI